MRILINIESGFIEKIDYSSEYALFERNGGNIGNKVFAQSIFDMLNIEENEIAFVELDSNLNIINYTSEEINEKFDLFVFATVIFGTGEVYIKNIDTYTNIVRNLTIPVFCFSVGTQASGYDEIDELVRITRDSTKRFVDEVLRTGGSLALRGDFTREYLSLLGYKDFCVTGCPSMYRNGRDFKVEYKQVAKENFNFSWNGDVAFINSEVGTILTNDYPKAEYLDQDQFVEILYGPQLSSLSYRNIRYLKNRYGFCGLLMLSQNRVHMICNYEEWKDYFIKNRISLSIGARIHGNIIAILSGIPACVYAIDSRTREMAEFFSIPMVTKNEFLQSDVYNIYLNLSFDKFNETYRQKYDSLDRLLTDMGICHDMNNVATKKQQWIGAEKQQYWELENVTNCEKIRDYLNNHKLIRYLLNK